MGTGIGSVGAIVQLKTPAPRRMSLLSTSLMPGSSSAWDERFAAWCQEGEQLCADAGGDPNPSSPFTAIMEEIMNLGGFAK